MNLNVPELSFPTNFSSVQNPHRAGIPEFLRFLPWNVSILKLLDTKSKWGTASGHTAPSYFFTWTPSNNASPVSSAVSTLELLPVSKNQFEAISKPKPWPGPSVLKKASQTHAGERPLKSVRKTKKEAGRHLPVLALDFHLFPPSPFLLPFIFFSTFKTSNFALGMSRMKCHLPIKRETGEKSCITSHTRSLRSRLASDSETLTMSE